MLALELAAILFARSILPDMIEREREGVAESKREIEVFFQNTCIARFTCLMMALELAVVGIVMPVRSPRLMYNRNAGMPSSRTPAEVITKNRSSKYKA